MTLRHAMAALAGATIALLGAATHAARASRGLTPAQRADLRSIAVRTWTLYDVDVDPNMSLPRDYVSEVGGLSRYYPADPVGKVARPYLAAETFSIGRE